MGGARAHRVPPGFGRASGRRRLRALGAARNDRPRCATADHCGRGTRSARPGC
ncbi:hypothetical protein GZL_07397 [Streptomyces sp. 769]|nr:hypothetical protein GZL_07397 [Streptomyces sp. 769]